MSSRTVCITGVGRRNGIARGIALRLVADGWDVAFNYWGAYDSRMALGGDPGDPDEIAAELRALGRRVVAVEADLRPA